MKDKSALIYHHLAIPTNQPRIGEVYVPHLKYAYVPGTRNAYGIEWIRFDDDAPYPDIVKRVAHVTFEVKDLQVALRDETLLVSPLELCPGVCAAFIDVLGAPVKLLQIDPGSSAEVAKNPVKLSGKPLKYHHTGIPGYTTWERETKVPHLKLAYLPGKYNTYGVEWLRFEEGNANPDIIKFTPHVAFEVPDIDQAIVGEYVLYHSGRSTPGIIVAMIEVGGAVVEFIELDRSIVGDQYDG